MEILTTVKANPIFALQRLDISDDKLFQLYKTIEYSLNDGINDYFLNFMINNINFFDHIYKMLPLKTVIDLSYKYNLLENHLTHQQVDEIINFHQKKFLLHEHKNLSNYLTIINKFNCTHNYIEKIYHKRLITIIPEQLRTLYENNEIIYGSDMIYDLGCNDKYKKIIDGILNVTWKIYLKKETSIKVPHYTNNYCVLHSNNITFEIINKIYPIEYIMFTEQLYGDNTNIYASPLKYHLLASDTYIMAPHYEVVQLENKRPNGLYHITLNTEKLHYVTNIEKHFCYNCKNRYDANHTFSRYKYMCFECGIYNFEFEKETMDMTNMVAFITGIRHTIGYSLALKMLRSGCTVIGTSRFPMCALYNYQNEIDYNIWKDRLMICQCDFLNIESVQKTIEFVKTHKPNIIINNACQTIRPTRNYYEKVLKIESDIKEKIKCVEQQTVSNQQVINICTDISHVNKWCVLHDVPKVETGLVIPVNSMRNVKDSSLVSVNCSWSLQLEQVSMTELLEVNVINQIVPTMIIQQLIEHMSTPAFVIQVSAKEGTFKSNKRLEQGTHAHTNMCKAGMNMLIRTLYERKMKDHYFYAVDPGYVSGTNIDDFDYPTSTDAVSPDKAKACLYPSTTSADAVSPDKAKACLYPSTTSADAVSPDKAKACLYPLSANDGAQRCLYPIISYLKHKPLEQGHWKDYKFAEW
jgi:NAD(P)-dependent dehydrogenase (short-subunit alcohol dehydrogenase family)